ncbi:MAG: ABC transporter permease [Acidobacteriota bacterium]
MRTSQLLRRNLAHYWRTNLAVVLGVATAVAVLSGALLVGDSVRASLRDLFVQRLGNTDEIITSRGFFREQLAAGIQSDSRFAAGGFSEACPLIALEGTVTHEPSRRVGSGIRVYGVDERFWRFHGLPGIQPPRNREIFVGESLAREMGAVVGDSLVLRVKKPSQIPAESLHSRKEDLGGTLRLTVRQTLGTEALGEFALQPQQSAVRAIFVPLSLLQAELFRDLGEKHQVNLILFREQSRAATDPATRTARRNTLERILQERTSLEDFGVKLRTEPKSISLEHESKMISSSLAKDADEAAVSLSMHPVPVLSYLANSISASGRSIPYSLVTAIGAPEFETLKKRATNERGTQPVSPAPADASASSLPPLVLNEWAAHDLGVSEGAQISLEYYLWQESGRLETKTAQFRLAGIVPIEGIAADRDLVPEYQGITGSESLADWDPPFPVNLKLVRKTDEDYWKKYRTTPKAFVPIDVGQALWQSRFGTLTSIRFLPSEQESTDRAIGAFSQKLRAALNPNVMGLSVVPVRAQGMEASRGATDFGEYFLYFSFFLVISALLLTALFFKLGIEQRLREIGVLQAVGFSASRIRRLFLAEGFVLSLIGSVLGLAGGMAYAQLMMFGLKTWWVDAVGTRMLSLHVSPFSLVIGALGGVVAALICVVWTLRRVGKASTRSLLTGTRADGSGEPAMRGRGERAKRVLSSLRIAILLSVAGVSLLIASALHLVSQVGGFFGSGVLLLAAFLCYQSAFLRRASKQPIHGRGWWPVARLGFRNATSRPGRSVLCIALIASAAFIIVAVDSFRHRGGTVAFEKKSGSGGFPLLAESLLPLVHDPNSDAGREALNLAGDAASALAKVSFARFRVRPGDDASCLNLYQPANPKIIAPRPEFLAENRFVFQDSLAATKEEKENPWLLLNREFPDGAVPIIADANSLTYVLHLKLGDDLVLQQDNQPLRLRVVGSLADSIFQSELIMAEKNFLQLFPEQEGYRFFLIDIPATEQPATVAAALEDRLSDFGFDVVSTDERLADFHRVENTYLSTFQMLGGLGLLLGTFGMAAVLLRNVFERRRELALLRAVGYNAGHFALMVIAENALLLFAGLATGTVCALLAIAPVFLSRHAQLPSISLGLLLLAVLASGLIASVVATWAALRSPLLPALRAE